MIQRLMQIRVASVTMLAMAAAYLPPAVAGVGDTLGIAVAAPNEIPGPQTVDHLDYSVADQIAYDDNVFRLPDDFRVGSIVGEGASRDARINTASVGVDGQWTFGRQMIGLNVRGDNNTYAENSDLDNNSGVAKLALNWRVGSVLSGQVGADFNRSLLGFAGTTFYAKDLADQEEYFGGARYQLGPHWAVFGGILRADTSYSATVARGNDSNSSTGDVGIEYDMDKDKTVGADYRHSNTRYTENAVLQNPNYREDTARLLLGYALTEKTQMNASVGYLKRDYDSSLLSLAGFAGDIWRGTLIWEPTEKTQVVVAAWRELQAFVAAEADYFVSKGESISPVWNISEKLRLSFSLSFGDQDYIPAANASVLTPRRDRISSRQITLAYTPTRSLTGTLSFTREQRSSNEHLYSYDDDLADASVAFKF